MPLLSFGSKTGKVKKMLESDQFQLVVEEATKDKKTREALFELLQDDNPGVVGDVLLTMVTLMGSNPDVIRPHLNGEAIKKLLSLVESKNSYVRENAMILLYSLAKNFPDLAAEYRSLIVEEAGRALESGDKNQKGFALILIGELGLRELEPKVRELVGVEDKVILPFEGKKWVKLGDIASETLEKLSGA
ncbi:hypothetical protein [Thermococcus zilligii]|uniref:hypothetical protein n=1 Tax=Thermococcus zilligii TaxID=54076 RepID=UPI00029A1F60|nr:hypothetical protein [Thermococcus zilligii]